MSERRERLLAVMDAVEEAYEALDALDYGEAEFEIARLHLGNARGALWALYQRQKESA